MYYNICIIDRMRKARTQTIVAYLTIDANAFL